MAVKNNEKYNEIIRLMLQDVPTDKIAERTGYSIYYIRDIYKSLREEYGVNTKNGIAVAFLEEKILEITGQLNEIMDIISRNNTPKIRGSAKHKR